MVALMQMRMIQTVSGEIEINVFFRSVDADMVWIGPLQGTFLHMCNTSIYDYWKSLYCGLYIIELLRMPLHLFAHKHTC